MNIINFDYSYRKDEEKILEPFLTSLEKELGGKRQPYSRSHGAIDLVVLLAMAASFTAGVAAQTIFGKYFEGLFDGDGWKQLGESHRQKIMTWLNEVKSDIVGTIQILEPLLDSYIISEGRAIALLFYLGEKQLYVTLNHQSCSKEILRNLPDGILQAVRFLIENRLPEDARIFQLYFDKTSKKWNYLFAPSAEGFGRWIDRYVDLETQEIKWIWSRREVLEKFRPESQDEYKFLVNPFIPPRH